MFKDNTIKELIDVLGVQTTQQLIAIRAINSTLKMKPADVQIEGNFKKRIVKKARKIIPLPDDVINNMIAFNCDIAIRESLSGCEGMGGYVEKPLIYYIEKHQLKVDTTV